MKDLFQKMWGSIRSTKNEAGQEPAYQDESKGQPHYERDLFKNDDDIGYC